MEAERSNVDGPTSTVLKYMNCSYKRRYNKEVVITDGTTEMVVASIAILKKKSFAVYHRINEYERRKASGDDEKLFCKQTLFSLEKEIKDDWWTRDVLESRIPTVPLIKRT